MSWLDDLIKGARQLAGNAVDVYGNTRGFAESGISEMLAGGPTMNTLVPKAKASDSSSSYPTSSYPTSSSIGGVDPLTGKVNAISPSGVSTGGGSGTGGGTPNAGGNAGGGLDLGEILKRQWERRQGEISSALDQARSVRDEVLGLVGKKRAEYQDLWTQGQKDITNTFEGEKGNARRTFGDLTSIEGNRARALGLGGSATDYASSRRSENLGRTLGDVNTNQSNNIMENKRTLDTRNTQADAWEADANRQYQGAENNAVSARNSAMDTQDNTLVGWLGNILNSQLAINQTKAGIGSDVANPYAVDTSKLTNFLNSTLTGGIGQDNTTQDQGVNLTTPTNLSDLLKKKSNPLYLGVN